MVTFSSKLKIYKIAFQDVAHGTTDDKCVLHIFCYNLLSFDIDLVRACVYVCARVEGDTYQDCSMVSVLTEVPT